MENNIHNYHNIQFAHGVQLTIDDSPSMIKDLIEVFRNPSANLDSAKDPIWISLYRLFFIISHKDSQKTTKWLAILSKHVQIPSSPVLKNNDLSKELEALVSCIEELYSLLQSLHQQEDKDDIKKTYNSNTPTDPQIDVLDDNIKLKKEELNILFHILFVT